MKFVILDRFRVPDMPFHVTKKILEDNGIECIVTNCKNDQDVIDIAKDADGIGLVYYNVSDKLISQLPQLKVIVRYGVGYDTIDIKSAGNNGIIVCNTPDYCRPDVAAHTLGLLLDVTRKITLLDRDVRNGNWLPHSGYKINRLSNLTVGTIGLGGLAIQFIKYLQPFGAKIISYDPFQTDQVFNELGVQRVSFDELLQYADIISIHTLLNDETHHLINKNSISKMKDGVIIINTSRGGIINTKDLTESLNTGKVKAAGLDVLEFEPPNINDDLFKCHNLVVTPHSAYNSAEAEVELASKVALSAIEVLIKQQIPKNIVNKKYFNSKS